MVRLNVPPGPISAEAARSAIRADDGGLPSQEDRRHALLDALRGLELGDTDTLILQWLSTWEPDTVAVVCSWLERARAQGAKPTAGGPETPKFTTTEVGPHARYGLPSWSQD